MRRKLTANEILITSAVFDSFGRLIIQPHRQYMDDFVGDKVSNGWRKYVIGKLAEFRVTVKETEMKGLCQLAEETMNTLRGK